MSIRMKVVLTACAVAVLALFVTTTFLSSQSVELITETELREMEIFGKVIESKLQDQVEATRALTLSVARNKEVEWLFALRDRESLIEMLLPVYEAVKDQYAQMHFHMPDSSSFLRLHQLQNYGDQLSDFRFTVNEANRRQETVAAWRKGGEDTVSGWLCPCFTTAPIQDPLSSGAILAPTLCGSSRKSSAASISSISFP